MSESVLNSFALTYASVTGERGDLQGFLVNFARADHHPVDACHLLTLLEELWPLQSTLALGVEDPALLLDLLRQPPRPWLALVLPPLLALDPKHQADFEQSRANGHRLYCQHQAGIEQIAHPCPWRLLDYGRGGHTQAQPGDWCLDVPSLALARECLQAGATGIVGWPAADVLARAHATHSVGADPASLQALKELLREEASLDQVEHALMRDPVLLWHLLRHVNPAGQPGQREPVPLRRALMLMGYGALERWLDAQSKLPGACPELRPLTRTLVLRAMFMEQLVLAGAEDALGREIYLCGLFSMIAPLLGIPAAEALSGLPLSERVSDALVGHHGPYRPFLDLVLASEGRDGDHVAVIAHAHGLDIAAVNRALLRSLAHAAPWWSA